MNTAKRDERKVALVTGGSRGLGRSAALHLARRGVGVILTYRRRITAAESTVSEIAKIGGQAVALQLDVGDTGSFAGFAARIRSVLQAHWRRESFDFLVNNAGVGIEASFAETSEAQFAQLLNVHFRGPFFLTQSLLPLLADNGRILNVSSGLARFTRPGFSAYAAMKGAVEVWTRYLAKELGWRGIAVNVVAPGAMETDFGGGLVRDNPEVNKFIAGQTAFGRTGVPEDIGGVIASLLSDENRWITGQCIEASGGMFL